MEKHSWRSVVRRKCVVLCCALQVCSLAAQAQTDGLFAGKQVCWSPRVHTAESIADDMRAYDVIHYGLDLTLAMGDEGLRGTSEITAVLLTSTDHITLHAVKLSLDSIRVDGVLRTPLVDSLSETFALSLGGIRPPGDTVRITLSYRRPESVTRPSSRRGYYYFTEEQGLPAALGYTMSEPSDARCWMPCKDEPWDKAPADISITLPTGYVPASNGALLGVRVHGDGTSTWSWREKHNIAPYLMSVTASRFAISTLPFVRAPADTVPLQYYTWQADSLECAQYLPTVRSMVSALSGMFGPYPFDKYGMTTIVPFAYGGMEHQTITTLNLYLKTDEQVVVHELAHQWWGDLVTCASWPDIWLNESFATYSEALWQESQGGFPALKSYMKNSLEHFDQGSWQGAVYDPESQGFGLFYDVVYSKGAWVLHTLRGVVGDSLFFRILASFRSQYAEKSATTANLESVVSNVVGADMHWFFHQWIYSPGWPIYAVVLNRSTSPSVVTLHQVQAVQWPTYTMPLRLRLFSGGRDTTIIVRDSLRTQTFPLPSAWIPDSLQLDPDGWILKQIGKAPATVVESDPAPVAFELHQNYPNPFNPATVIEYTVGEASNVRLVVYDLLGREVAELVQGEKPAGRYEFEFNASGLASGVYICRLTAGDFVASRKMLLAK